MMIVKHLKIVLGSECSEFRKLFYARGRHRGLPGPSSDESAERKTSGSGIREPEHRTG